MGPPDRFLGPQVPRPTGRAGRQGGRGSPGLPPPSPWDSWALQDPAAMGSQGSRGPGSWIYHPTENYMGPIFSDFLSLYKSIQTY